MPNTVIAEHRSAGCRRAASPPATRPIDVLDNDHRLYADNRRTQIDMRFAKIFRFGRGAPDIGVDLGNLLNTNYATTLREHVSVQRRQHGAGRHVEQPDGDLHAAVRPLNFTVDF